MKAISLLNPFVGQEKQVLLGYLIKKAFGEDNKFNLWTKTSSCFLIKGERPHPASITTSLYRIKLEGRMKMMCKELDKMLIVTITITKKTNAYEKEKLLPLLSF